MAKLYTMNYIHSQPVVKAKRKHFYKFLLSMTVWDQDEHLWTHEVTITDIDKYDKCKDKFKNFGSREDGYFLAHAPLPSDNVLVCITALWDFYCPVVVQVSRSGAKVDKVFKSKYALLEHIHTAKKGKNMLLRFDSDAIYEFIKDW